MKDIVERLRWHREHPLRGRLELANPDGEEAADTITALRAEVERLRAALVQIAAVGYVATKNAPSMHDEAVSIARAALTTEQKETSDGK